MSSQDVPPAKPDKQEEPNNGRRQYERQGHQHVDQCPAAETAAREQIRERYADHAIDSGGEHRDAERQAERAGGLYRHV